MVSSQFQDSFVRRSRRAAFSLLELILSMVLITGLLMMSFVSMKPAIEQEGPRGLVHTLAADLRAARAEALRGGRPVAFCFPSDGRTNSLSRSAHIRIGEQRGLVWRTLVYDTEYEAIIFLGKWGEAIQEKFELPPGWRTSTSREMALYFWPDGTVFSEDIPCWEGRYPIVIGSAMAGNFSGSEGTVRAIRHPQTVWISKRGTIEVFDGEVPVGTLPSGGDAAASLSIARLEDEKAPSGSPPTILSSTFLPQQIEGLPTAGIGQNFVQIHPNQKEGQQLEYGLATIEVCAEDVDGGPLRYRLRATASRGDSGKFTVSEKVGDLSYIYDETKRRYLWKAVVSWRPPPSASPNLTYQLFLTVLDPEGHSVEVSTEAELLPAVTSLPPARLVICSSDQQIFLTNLDGANEVLLTRDGAEHSPFFSQDGSCLFSFHNQGGGGKELRSRPANGSTGYTRLASFAGSTSNVIYDPTYTFAALINPAGTFKFDWGQVTESGGSSSSSSDDEEDDDDDEPSYSFSQGAEDIEVSNVYILSLMASEPPIRVTRTGTGEFFWAANARHTFLFEEEIPLPKIMEQGFGPFSPFPGHRKERPAKYLVGFPPHIVPADVEPISAAGRVYNPANRDWYLAVVGNSLVAGYEPSGRTYNLYTGGGGIEHSDTGRENPSWSADGERVVFIASPGPSSRIISMRVLDSGFNALVSPSVEFELSMPASRAQLSPGGEWVYFLSGQKLYRADNRTGSELVEITGHLKKAISDYAVSP